jgi:alanyl-tRNA synthetase
MAETERLYYTDPYLQRFTARVLERRTQGGRVTIALDRTAFYPTGGGQPNDTGALSGAPVVDVSAEDGLVWHVLDGDAPEGDALGVVDWARRFDHMQQHTGQHILSQAFIATCDAETVAFHLGATASTIDLGRNDLTPEEIARAEARANAVVDAALPVTATFVDEVALADLPLRKPPKVTEKIRIVQVQGFDWSACGGTHVASSAEVGLIKVTGLERRGPELRVTFLCGRRARADYTRLQALRQGLASRFNVGQDEALAAVDRLAAEQRALRKAHEALEADWAASEAAALYAAAERVGEWRLVVQTLECPVERARLAAQALRARAGAVVLLGVRAPPFGGPQLVFTRADDVSLDMGGLLRNAASAAGGKGGGRPDWAQGGAPDDAALAAVLTAARGAVLAHGGKEATDA